MKNTSLESKTVRPGSFSYYHSSVQSQPTTYSSKSSVAKKGSKKFKIFATAAVLVLALGFYQFQKNSATAPTDSAISTTKKSAPANLAGKTTKSNNVVPAEQSACNSNNLDKAVIVSISKRHMWACEKSNQVKDAPVISGMEPVESTKTPVGTFHIYGKVKDTALSGTDPTTGPWREPVNYWMPYYDNQYGTYGFHDAPWRKTTEFGSIDPNSMNGSHGCVQLMTDTAAWLYDWAPVGTTVIVNS